jgi:DnaJ-class molecular chaperone
MELDGFGTIIFQRIWKKKQSVMNVTEKAMLRLMNRSQQKFERKLIMRIRCPECHGSGRVSCKRCNGTGIHKYLNTFNYPNGRVCEDECPDCAGSGEVVCPICNGDGRMDEFG